MDYDVIVIGTGFASSFFLKKFLERRGGQDRILVLERGPMRPHAERLATRLEESNERATDFYRGEGLATKSWNFSIAFGGSSNCWWGNTPRFLPADFAIASRFGHGRDWPIGYDEIEPYYSEAEQIMEIAGSDENYPHPRSAAFPLPPHNFSNPEAVLRQAYPASFFPMPTARASRTTKTRARCCANDVCSLCPVSAKFTVENGLGSLYQQANVTLLTGALVHSIETQGGQVTGVEFTHEGQQKRASGSLVVLGANAMFNPVVLANSGMDHPLLGKRLHEQYGLLGDAYLDGMDSFQGSTSVTGIGYMLWDDEERRRTLAPALLETKSVGLMRMEPGRWRQVLPIRLVYEDIPSDENFVAPDPQDRDKPVARFTRYSDYLTRSADRAYADLEKILAALPIERVELRGVGTEAHIQGTTVMGNDAADSIVDADCLHHRYRNLLVLGSSVFPSCSPANPTLTISALSLRAAERLVA
jgi:choline dehydrogenase-like flavoprotein